MMKNKLTQVKPANKRVFIVKSRDHSPVFVFEAVSVMTYNLETVRETFIGLQACVFSQQSSRCGQI